MELHSRDLHTHPTAQDDTSIASGTMATLEEALQNGRAFVERNPMLAIIGGASVVALVVIAAKSARPSRDPNSWEMARVRDEWRRLSSTTAQGAHDAGAALASALGRFVPSDAASAAALRDVASEWVSKLIHRARDVGVRTGS